MNFGAFDDNNNLFKSDKKPVFKAAAAVLPQPQPVCDKTPCTRIFHNFDFMFSDGFGRIARIACSIYFWNGYHEQQAASFQPYER